MLQSLCSRMPSWNFKFLFTVLRVSGWVSWFFYQMSSHQTLKCHGRKLGCPRRLKGRIPTETRDSKNQDVIVLITPVDKREAKHAYFLPFKMNSFLSPIRRYLLTWKKRWYRIGEPPITRGIFARLFFKMRTFWRQIFHEGIDQYTVGGSENNHLTCTAKCQWILSGRSDQKQKSAKKWIWLKHFH